MHLERAIVMDFDVDVALATTETSQTIKFFVVLDSSVSIMV